MPFGVNLPDDLGSSAPVENGGAPGAAPEGAAPEFSSESQGTQTPSGSDVLDLDKHETFRFKGRDWTREEFEKGYLRQQDYTQKTQSLNETKKYYDNFWVDFRTVQEDPNRMSDFERIYPKEFVEHARTMLGRAPSSTPRQAADPNAPKPKSLMDDPAFRELKQSVEKITSKERQEEVKRIDGWLKNQYESLEKKYPYADREVVEGRALMHAQQHGGKSITAEFLDQAFKAHNDQAKKRMDQLYKAKVNQQLNAGRDARDVGVGGDIAGGAPRSDRTLKQAKERMLADAAAGRLGVRG